MTLKVVLDANVLFSQTLRDIFFEFALSDLIKIFWSSDIKSETAKNLKLRNLSHAETFLRTSRYLELALPRTLLHYTPNEWSNPDVNAKDWHVYDFALQINADFIATWNLKDFPRSSSETSRCKAVTPDAILTSIYCASPFESFAALDELRVSYSRPSLDWPDFLSKIDRTGCTKFPTIIRTTS